MLKLKKIHILGFKSFCDRTELTVPGTGIAVVVGPNGCGKSNILDGVSWVLGEQSAKTLRGANMQDVIFAGTRERKPQGMAEVTLTMVDPAAYEGPIPALHWIGTRTRCAASMQQRPKRSQPLSNPARYLTRRLPTSRGPPPRGRRRWFSKFAAASSSARRKRAKS
jgi:Fe-S cluster assembly ATPase SufC